MKTPIHRIFQTEGQKPKHSLHCLTATLLAMLLAVMAPAIAGCSSSGKGKATETPYRLPDTLRVGVLNSPTTYFIYRGVPMGYDYDLLRQFADSNNVHLELKVATNFPDLLAMLDKDSVDLVASPVPSTLEYKEKVLLCGPSEKTHQVLVQRKGSGAARDVTELIGHHITVEKDSKFDSRLQNLNSELGGGIVIETIRKDTLVSEDMIDMVDDGRIEMTVVDSDIAGLSIPDYPRLDASLALSLDQLSRWAVRKNEPGLAESLDQWFGNHGNLEERLRKKYFGSAKRPAGLDEAAEADHPSATVAYAGGAISPYDALFRQAAEGSGFDWRMVAAVAYVESRFKPDLVSWAGARGIMQVMPASAKALGFSPARMNEPAECIRAGVKMLQTLDRSLAAKVPDPEKRLDFVLASYNAGMGHILDAIALASKHGMDSRTWAGQVEQAALLKSRPEYYRDPVVKNGYFRAKETVDFVRRVRAAHRAFSEGKAKPE